MRARIVTRRLPYLGSAMACAEHALERRPQNGSDLLERDPVLQEALFLTLLKRGVYTAPRGSLNLGLAVTEFDIDHYLYALDESLGELSDVM